MRFIDYNEPIEHRTGSFPLAYYAVDENHPRYHMRVHWHRETELTRVTKGSLRMFIGNRPITVEAGECAVLGEGVLHGGEPEHASYESVVFDPAALLMHPEPCRSIVRELIGRSYYLNLSGMSASDIHIAIDRLFDGAASADCMRVMAALYEFYGFLRHCEPLALEEGATRGAERTEQLKPALEYIEQNYDGRITLEVLARLTGLSPKYFCRSFRAIVHESPIEYVNHYRIECASQLLAGTDKSVAEIAQLCGFADSSFFIKQFRRYKGTTPHRYRMEGNETNSEQNKHI